MLDNRISVPRANRWISVWIVATLPGFFAFAPDEGLAKDRTHALQGLFCNTAEQIDEALTHMRRGLSPRSAVELANRDAVVCTFVDVLHYVVDRPVVIKEIRGSPPMFKYQGALVAVVAGGTKRPVIPPVQIFFAIPERLHNAPLEGRA
ncbi:MAG: hypothetical protein ACOZAM_07905 [Pseudomonadota bacterium]